MPADVIDLAEYKKALELEELERLSAEVGEIIKSLPEQDPLSIYSDSGYFGWSFPDLNLEYVYEQLESCPYCGKSCDEE